MRRCFRHTHLRQNAVFHSFSRQIAFIQYSGPSKHAWAFSETVQKISKITYTASLPPRRFQGNSVFNSNLSIKTVKKFLVYQYKLSLSLALLYLVDLFINKLKTKFNNLALQNDFEYKKNSQLLLKKFPRIRAKQMPSKVLFVSKKKGQPRPFGHCVPKL